MRFRDWVTAISGVVAIAFAIFAVGGVLRWTQAVVALLVAVSIGGTLASRRSLSRPSPLIAMLGTACGLCAIQLLPLPDVVRGILAPTTTGLRDDGAELLDLSTWPALTSDVPGTLAALVFFAILLGLAVVALRMATSERGRYRLLAAVGGMCGLVALTVGVHHVLGLHALFGIYEPVYAQPRLLGPLLNTNSLACLMAVGAVLGIGLAAYPRQASWLRVLWLISVAGCGVITASVISRGAMLALTAGGLVTISILLAQRLSAAETPKRRRLPFVTNALPLGIVAGCLVVLVIYANAGKVGRQFEQMSLQEMNEKTSKFAAWKSSTKLIEDSPWVGIGRGAFEASFTRVHPASGALTYSHLENEYLQAVVDWGVPGALLLAVGAIWLALVALKRWRDGALTAGAIGAVAVVAMQSNVDFGVEFLGIAAPITIVAATLAYVPLRDSPRRSVALGTRLAHIGLLALGAVLLLSAKTTSLEEDHVALASRRRPPIAKIRESLERHPLDYYGYALAAETYERAGDRRAIRLLNHAMTLHPTHPGLHRLAALMLYRDGYIGQATIEYAAAIRATDNPTKLIGEVLARFGTREAALALPTDYVRTHVIVQALADLGRTDVTTLWLERVLEINPKYSRACDFLHPIALQDGGDRAAEVVGRRCIALMPDYQARLSLAQALQRRQRHEDVLRVLSDVESWQSRLDDKITAWLVLCDAQIALDRVEDAKRCVRRLDASPDMRMERRNEILKRLESLQKPREPLVPVVAPAGSAATP